MLEITSTIEAKNRQKTGKGGARKLRRDGCVPAVAYGPSQTPRLLTLDPKLFPLQRQRFGLSHLYDVKVDAPSDGGPTEFKALIKGVSVDPISRRIEHVDLYAVDMARAIRAEVPIELTGKAAGLIDGGLLSQILHTIEVTCLPNDIPAKLVGDVTKLGVGDSLHISDLTLPDGVRLTGHGDEAIAQVTEPEEAPAAVEDPAVGAGAPAAAGSASAASSASAPAKAGDKK